MTLFPGKDAEDFAQYKTLCQESGWTFIGRENYMNLFEAREGMEPTPLETDEHIDFETMKSGIFSAERLSGLVCMFFVFAIELFYFRPYVFAWEISGWSVGENMDLLLLIVFALAALAYTLVDEFKIWRSVFRMKRALEAGLPLKEVREGRTNRDWEIRWMQPVGMVLIGLGMILSCRAKGWVWIAAIGAMAASGLFFGECMKASVAFQDEKKGYKYLFLGGAVLAAVLLGLYVITGL